MSIQPSRRELPFLALAFPLSGDDKQSALWDGFPRQNYQWAKDVVGASHADLDKVKSIVEPHPAAANATIDWGFGDYETALGAAAHMGRRAIAEYLLENGARLDLFAAAMLGMTPVVKAMIEARPGIERTAGPHGIPLLAHARAGGVQAKDTLAYLETLPDAGKGIPIALLDNERRKLFAGVYEIAGGPKAEITLSSPGQLSLQVGTAVPRWIHHAGSESFYPVGAPKVRIEFEWKEKRPFVMRIVDGPTVFSAVRVNS